MATFPVLPSRTALINVDVQECFVENTPLAAPDGPAVVQRINHLAQACRSAGILVVHTRGWMRPDGSNLGVMSALVPQFITDLYTAGAPSAELHHTLVVEDRDIVLDKPRYGAFHGTDLEMILRHNDIDTVIVTGIATNICCETTAREAAVRDFKVKFCRDATATREMAGVSAETLTRATCASLSMVFAQITTVEELLHDIGTAANTAEHEPANIVSSASNTG